MALALNSSFKGIEILIFHPVVIQEWTQTEITINLSVDLIKAVAAQHSSQG